MSTFLSRKVFLSLCISTVISAAVGLVYAADGGETSADDKDNMGSCVGDPGGLQDANGQVANQGKLCFATLKGEGGAGADSAAAEGGAGSGASSGGDVATGGAETGGGASGGSVPSLGTNGGSGMMGLNSQGFGGTAGDVPSLGTGSGSGLMQATGGSVDPASTGSIGGSSGVPSLGTNNGSGMMGLNSQGFGGTSGDVPGLGTNNGSSMMQATEGYQNAGSGAGTATSGLGSSDLRNSFNVPQTTQDTTGAIRAGETPEQAIDRQMGNTGNPETTQSAAAKDPAAEINRQVQAGRDAQGDDKTGTVKPETSPAKTGTTPNATTPKPATETPRAPAAADTPRGPNTAPTKDPTGGLANGLKNATSALGGNANSLQALQSLMGMVKGLTGSSGSSSGSGANTTQASSSNSQGCYYNTNGQVLCPAGTAGASSNCSTGASGVLMCVMSGTTGTTTTTASCLTINGATMCPAGTAGAATTGCVAYGTATYCPMTATTTGTTTSCITVSGATMCPLGTAGITTTGCVLSGGVTYCPMAAATTVSSTTLTDDTLYQAGFMDGSRGLTQDSRYSLYAKYVEGYTAGTAAYQDTSKTPSGADAGDAVVRGVCEAELSHVANQLGYPAELLVASYKTLAELSDHEVQILEQNADKHAVLASTKTAFDAAKRDGMYGVTFDNNKAVSQAYFRGYQCGQKLQAQ